MVINNKVAQKDITGVPRWQVQASILLTNAPTETNKHTIQLIVAESMAISNQTSILNPPEGSGEPTWSLTQRMCVPQCVQETFMTPKDHPWREQIPFAKAALITL